MNKWLKRLSNWFLQIENEVMVPFVLVGILVIGSFSMISYYNGYTMQKNSELELADTLFEDVNRDLNFLEKRLPEEEIAEKYRNFERGRQRRRRQNPGHGVLPPPVQGQQAPAEHSVYIQQPVFQKAVGKIHRCWQSARGKIHLAGGWSTG